MESIFKDLGIFKLRSNNDPALQQELLYGRYRIKDLDFTKYDFFQHKADCYFFNDPIKNDSIFIEIVKNIINFSLDKKNILLIFVNCNDKLFLSLKNIKLIDKYYLNEKKGYFIYCVSKND